MSLAGEINTNRMAPNQGTPIPQVQPRQPLPNNTPTQPVKPKMQLNLFKSKPFRIFRNLSLIIIGFVIAFFLVFATGLDTTFVKLQLKGIIVDSRTLEPIPNATISVDGTERAKTDQNGNYLVKNLNRGNIQLKVSATDYFDEEGEIKLDRTFTNYTTTINLKLSSSKLGTLKGKFITNDENYEFTEEIITINDEGYKVNADGTFEINDIPTGQVNFVFSTSSFKDLSQSIEIKAGLNTLQDINLEPKGDIEGRFLDYITGDVMTNVKVEVNNISEDQINISENGTLLVKDLEIGKEYVLRFKVDGYVTRDYTIQLKQGKNNIPNLNMVKEGTVYFFDSISRDRYQIFSSEIDGLKQSQLTTTENLNPYFHYYDTEKGVIYFMSIKDSIRGPVINRTSVPLVYQYKIDTGTVSQVTTNINGLDSVFYVAGHPWLINVRKDNRNSTTTTIEQRELNGIIRKVVKTVESTKIIQALVGKSGEHIYTLEQKEGDSKFSIYLNHNNSNKLVRSATFLDIYDISFDGTRILFSETSDAGFSELKLYDSVTNEIRTLIPNHFGQFYQFIENSNNVFIYIDAFNNKESIELFNIAENKNEQIIALKANDDSLGLYQQAGRFYYITEQEGLSIIDIEKPKAYVTVKREGAFKY